jgi:hypothetical protein
VSRRPTEPQGWFAQLLDDTRGLLGVDIAERRHEVWIAASGKQRRRRMKLTNTMLA